MHEIIDKKFYLGPKFGTLINKKWITISELLHLTTLSAIRVNMVSAYLCKGLETNIQLKI
jgi:hypothetical protein